MTDKELYQALVNLCQQFGFTTEHTYDLLHSAVESIIQDDEEIDEAFRRVMED